MVVRGRSGVVRQSGPRRRDGTSGAGQRDFRCWGWIGTPVNHGSQATSIQAPDTHLVALPANITALDPCLERIDVHHPGTRIAA